MYNNATTFINYANTGVNITKMGQSRQTSGVNSTICGYNTNPEANNGNCVGKVS